MMKVILTFGFIYPNYDLLPNGWRYPLVGGTRQRHFDGTRFKPRKLLENAQTPASRVHAVLGGFLLCQIHSLEQDNAANLIRFYTQVCQV
jgi:hypothetical protein